MKKRPITLFLAMLMIAMLTAGCAQQTTPTDNQISDTTIQPTDSPIPPSQDIVNEVDSEGKVTIVDVLGNELALPETAPVRIISLSAANTEILFALGLGEYVVGVDEYSNYPAETADIAKVGDFSGPNVEAILALEPDLILAGNKLQLEAVSQLVELGINVAAVEATTYQEVFSSIQLVGDLTLTSEKAQDLIDQMKAREGDIIAQSEQYKGEEISVYYVMFAGDGGNWTSGPGSYINDMFKLINVKPVTEFEGAVPWMDFSLEMLVAENPDVLLLSSYSGLDAETLSQLEGYKELTAVKENRIIIVDAEIVERASVRIVDALEIIYNAIYNNQ